MKDHYTNLQNLKTELRNFFDFEYEKIQSGEFDYHVALILGIYTLLKFKDNPQIQSHVNSVIHEYENRISQNDEKSSMFLNVINEFRYDFFPDGYWSKFPNIWEEDITEINKYIAKINTTLKKQFLDHLNEFESK